MKFAALVLSTALFTGIGATGVAHAQDTQQAGQQANQDDLYSASLHTSSCSARSIDRYYCPWFGGQFQGPYFDNGCSVRCAAGHRAVCVEASCDENQNGQPVESSCSCR